MGKTVKLTFSTKTISPEREREIEIEIEIEREKERRRRPWCVDKRQQIKREVTCVCAHVCHVL